MTKHKNMRATLPLVLLALTAALPTTPAYGEGVDSDSEGFFTGTTFNLAPPANWQGATVRIAGPDGYAATRTFEANTRISINLITDAEPRRNGSSAWGALPDGHYTYEVTLVLGDGARRTRVDVFFVDGGQPVDRSAMRKRLGQAARELGGVRSTNSAAASAEIGSEGMGVNDYVAVHDQAQDNLTQLVLANDGFSDWEVQDFLGSFKVDVAPGSGGLVINPSGHVGLGTSAPADRLHLVGGGLRVDNGSTFHSLFQVAGGAGLFPGVSLTPTVFLDNGGNVGIGTLSPEADFHLSNADGIGDTTFKFALPGAGSWNFGLTSTEVLTFNKSGSGGQEFTIRERNHAVASLDVQGHVKGTSFKASSSRRLKTGFEAVNPAEVLARVSELPVTSWRYRTEAEGVRHFGPVAEDFQHAFGLGDGESIATVDADGVAFAAIQGLKQELDVTRSQLADRGARIAALEARLAALEALLAP